MTEFNPYNEIPARENVTPTLSEQIENIGLFIPSAVAATYPLILNVPFGGTISSLTIKSSVGSATLSVFINGIGVTGLVAKSVSTTEASYAATAASFSALSDITISFSGSLTNVSVNLAVIRALPSSATSTITVGSTTIDGTKEEYVDVALTNGSNLLSVPFAVAKTDFSGVATAVYRVDLAPVENLTDATVLALFPVIVGKTSTGLTLRYSAIPDSANYYQRGHIKVI